MENTTLNHWGIKGMRWGIRRFQNKDGSLTPEGKKRYDDTPDDPEAAKKAYEEGKQKAIKSGSATDVLKYKGDLTKTEMQSALERIRWEDEMKKYGDKELAPGKSAAEKTFDKLGKVTDYAVTGAKAWNMVANVVNAFNGPDGMSLPKIDTNIANDNKDKRKAEKKEKEKESKGKKTDLNKSDKDIENMSDDELAAFVKRGASEKTAKAQAAERGAAAKAIDSGSNIAEQILSSPVGDSPVSASNQSQTAQTGKKYVDKIIVGSAEYYDLLSGKRNK